MQACHMSQRIPRPTNGGFALINALVAATVLATGLLGSAAMLVHSLQASRLALQQTQAVALAADMADRLRANSSAGAAFALSPGTILDAPSTACATVNQCSPQQVAALELYLWQQSVMRVLPDPQVAIAVSPAATSAASLYTITIRWMQSGQATAASIALTVQA
jgi:type IV pilus assembly protein PilV